ncbi:AraC family transcriptional regulator [Thiomonas sp. FB-6]|uniref:AraC-like ligand-binding domain-containing protein n=1 Tax=Thiomonas sp. FB-6 TaxID=1158291 RepID=UPI00035F52B8|nr:AraC family transcriptional regulator [Thiomonas sp. FB-6]
MQTELFTTDPYPVQERPERWREALQPHHLRARMDTAREPLHATLLAARSPLGITMAAIRSSAQRLVRRAAPPQELWLCLHMSGPAWLHEAGRQRALDPGDMVYGTARSELELSFDGDFRQFMLRVPVETLKSRLAGPLRASSGCLSGRHGMGHVLSGTLAALANAFDSLDAGQLQCLEQSLPEIVAASLADEVITVAQQGLRTPQAALLHRALRHVDTHLSDSGLSLAEVARLEGVSARTLQKLFEASGRTFSGNVPPSGVSLWCGELRRA